MARGLIEIGPSLPAIAEFNVVDLLPSNQAVADGVKRRASELRAEFKGKLISICQIRGGISCDGLKQPITGCKHYYLVLHYVEAGSHW